MRYTNVMLAVIVVLTAAVTYRVYTPVATGHDAANPVVLQGGPMPAPDTVDWNPSVGLTIRGSIHMDLVNAESVVATGTDRALQPCDKYNCAAEDASSGMAGMPVTLRVFRSGGGDSTITLKHGARFVLRKRR